MPTEEDEDIFASTEQGIVSVTATNAIYTLPVDAELAHAATFRVGNVGLTALGKDGVQIGYQVPRELTGSAQVVQFDGKFKDGTRKDFVASGGIGTSDCSIKGTRLRCVEHLPKLDINVDAAMQLVPADVDAAARRRVIEQFPGEPIGILEADLPRRRSPR